MANLAKSIGSTGFGIIMGAALLIQPTVAEAQAASALAASVAVDTAPSVHFRAPRDGAAVPRTFEVSFGLRNYGVAPAGVNLSRTGHFHILIDVPAPDSDAIVPADSLHRHYGGGQIETMLTLPPGRHTLQLVLADHEHRVIMHDGKPLMSERIRVTVR
ncbi:MAG TPA: DUF4399 domain-containing protein [Gemmatimonadaceae bacterium]|nr:DUF4399 domain-containing protein [Gemmatimonadaceae bacterium]